MSAPLRHIEPEGRRSARSNSGRQQVLTFLRGENRAVAIADVAERLGLHPNTVRLHLDSLVEMGLATRGTQRGDGRGRPRLVYTAGEEHRLDPSQDASEGGGYRLLAQIMTSHVESTAARPIEEAASAGRAWGRLLAQQRAPSDLVGTASSVGEATSQLAELLDDLGFAPGAAVPGETIEVYHCPFGQAPGRHSSVVCAVHLGLMQGALAGRGAPMQATSVEPFVTPRMCVARLDATAPAATSTPIPHSP